MTTGRGERGGAGTDSTDASTDNGAAAQASSRRWKVATLVLSAVLLLAVGGSVGFIVADGSDSQGDDAVDDASDSVIEPVPGPGTPTDEAIDILLDQLEVGSVTEADVRDLIDSVCEFAATGQSREEIAGLMEVALAGMDGRFSDDGPILLAGILALAETNECPEAFE